MFVREIRQRRRVFLERRVVDEDVEPTELIDGVAHRIGAEPRIAHITG